MDGNFFVAFRERHPGGMLAERRYLGAFHKETDSFPRLLDFLARVPRKKSFCDIHEAADKGTLT